LCEAGELHFELPGGATAVVWHGVLRSGDDPVHDHVVPLPRELADEVAAVASWLTDNAAGVRLVACRGQWALPTAALPSFAVPPSRASRR
jgi:hypothetical protein